MGLGFDVINKIIVKMKKSKIEIWLITLILTMVLLQNAVGSQIWHGIFQGKQKTWDQENNQIQVISNMDTYPPNFRLINHGTQAQYSTDQHQSGRNRIKLISSNFFKHQQPQNQQSSFSKHHQIQQNEENSPQNSIIRHNNKIIQPNKIIQNSIRQLQIIQPAQPPIIKNSEFSNVQLFHTLPNTFKKGQTYFFKGRVLKEKLPPPTSANKAIQNVVYISFRNLESQEQSSCQTTFSSENNYTFEVGCTLTEIGRYRVLIFTGQYGVSSRRLRNVVDEDKFMGFESFNSSAEGVRLEIQQNDLYVLWQSQEDITKLTFTQPGNIAAQKQYILTNKPRIFKVPFIDFRFFREVETVLQISHADSEDGTLYTRTSQFSDSVSITFLAAQHKFAKMLDGLAKIDPPIPWRMKVGEKFTIKGVFESPITSIVYLVGPNLKITEINLIKNLRFIGIPDIISAGTPINVQISFQIPGAHLLQINSASGQSLISRPIYVGESYPLTPDFEDLKQNAFRNFQSSQNQLQQYVATTTTNQRIEEPASNSDINTKRQYLLVLTNALRQKYGVGPLVLDQFLSEMAQSHADDMRDNNYFSHTDLKGNGPGERAIQQGFKGAIGENLAFSYTLTQAHLSLERSASHLANTIKESWMRTGIGISMRQDGALYVVFLFSERDVASSPLSDQQMLSDQQKFVALIQQINPLMAEDEFLSNVITQWARSDQSTDLFSYMRTYQIRGSITSSSFEISYQKDWVSRLRGNINFLTRPSTLYKTFGVGFAINAESIVQAYLVFKS